MPTVNRHGKKIKNEQRDVRRCSIEFLWQTNKWPKTKTKKQLRTVWTNGLPIIIEIETIEIDKGDKMETP